MRCRLLWSRFPAAPLATHGEFASDDLTPLHVAALHGFARGGDTRARGADGEAAAAALLRAARLGLGHIVALYYRSSTLYQIRSEICCLYIRNDNETEP